MGGKLAMIPPSLKISLLVAWTFAATARAESGDGKAEARNKREASVDAKGVADEEAYRQARLKEQFEQFKSQLIRLAQRLEQTSDASNTDKAKVLRQAINKVNDLGTEIKFERLVNQLRSAGKDLTLDDLSSIMEKQEDLHADIRSILVILLTDDRGRIKKEIEAWKIR